MHRCLLLALLAFCVTGASPLDGPPVRASVNGSRDTEHDESTASTNTGLSVAGLGPEVPDMLSGVVVNQTYLHKADSDNDEPGIVVAPVPELDTRRNEPDHETNLTDKVNSTRVLDPGTTHQEDFSNKSSAVILKAENNTKEDSTNVSLTTLKPAADVSTVVPEIQPAVANNTVQSSSNAESNKTIEESTAYSPVKKTEEQTAEKPAGNNTKEVAQNGTQAPPSTSRPEEVATNPTSAKAPAKNETKPPLSPSEQVEVFAPPMPNETQNLLVGYQPQTSEQHADHLQLSGTADPSFLQPSQSAAILAGVFVVVALLGYVGLLVWRRLLEKKYGNREMLVNEDEFYDTSDLRHFEL